VVVPSLVESDVSQFN